MSSIGPTTPEEKKVLKPKANSEYGYKRLFALGPERVAVLNSFLITESYSMDQVVDTIQKEWKELTDIPPASLRRQLFRYKKTYILPHQAKIAAKATKAPVIQKLAAVLTEVESVMDPIRELQKLATLQLKRIKKLETAEDTLPNMVMDVQTKNIALGMELLTRLKQAQLDVGILKKVPEKLAISADLTDEERKYVEQARIHKLEQEAMSEALKYLVGERVLVAENLPPPPSFTRTESNAELAAEGDELEDEANIVEGTVVRNDGPDDRD